MAAVKPSSPQLLPSPVCTADCEIQAAALWLGPEKQAAEPPWLGPMGSGLGSESAGSPCECQVQTSQNSCPLSRRFQSLPLVCQPVNWRWQEAWQDGSEPKIIPVCSRRLLGKGKKTSGRSNWEPWSLMNSFAPDRKEPHPASHLWPCLTRGHDGHPKRPRESFLICQFKTLSKRENEVDWI